MFDRKVVNKRFLECYSDMSWLDLAQYFSVHYSAVPQWNRAKRSVPWSKLNHLVSTRGVSWDWLLEGRGEKIRGDFHRDGGDVPYVEGRLAFDWNGINDRALSLFGDSRQEDIAKELGVSQSAVSSWKTYRKQVPWEKLKILVDDKHVTWDWLIEGGA